MATSHSDHHEHSAAPLAIPAIDVSPVRTAALAALVIGSVAFIVLAYLNISTSDGYGLRDIFMSYTVGFVFWASLPFGALSMTLIAFLTSASWGVVLRRCFHAATRTMPVVAVLFIPVAASVFIAEGKQSPFWWSDQSWVTPTGEMNSDPAFQAAVKKMTDNKVKQDVAEIAVEKGLRPEAIEENQHKIHDFLNPVFFTVRGLLYFSIIGGLIFIVNKWARRAEDDDQQDGKDKLRAIAGPGIIVWTLVMTMMGTDWVMSVEPTWASSMFPIVYGMNMFLTTFAFSIFVFYSLNAGNTEVLTIVKDKFRIDIGSLLLALTMVWAYASFSQYMLIWAGNLPEEITYYRKRGDHGWEYLAYFLMAFHWLIPFVVLLFREVKTNPKSMRILSGMLIVVCMADVIWWILPAVEREHGTLHVPMAIAAIVAVGGIWGVAFARELGKRPILPANSEGKFLATWGQHH